MAKELQQVRDAIDSEGFDYAFRGYSNFGYVEDGDFHHLRRDYVNAANALESYVAERSVGEMDEGDEEEEETHAGDE